ncbi:uncharacterized protein METZ01_LOCUS379353, partial [marine metagenome]
NIKTREVGQVKHRSAVDSTPKIL